MKVVPPVTMGSAGGFTRASSGTFIGSNGLLQTATSDVPRFSYNPASLSSAPAFLQEAAATNSLLRNRDGTNAAWTKTDTTTAHTQTGIDGTSNSATLFTEGTAGTAVVLQAATAVAAGSTVTYSEYLKIGNTNWVRLFVGETALTDYAEAWFNLSTGVVGSTAAHGAATLVAARISQGPSGYYRCEITTKPNASYTVPKGGHSSASADASVTRVNNATYTTDYALLEVGSVATSAIATTSGAVTRAADVLTGQGFMYSSVAEPDATIGEVAWVSGTTYAADAQVVVVAQHRTYQRVSAGAGTTSPELDDVNWVDIGPTNRWGMLDLYRDTATEQATSMTVVLKPGTRADSIGILGTETSSVIVSVDVGATNYFYKTFSGLIRHTVGLYSYLFGAFRFVPNIVALDLPPITGATITLKFVGTNVKCAGVIVGMQAYIGELYDVKIDDLNFSVFDRSTFGRIKLTPRPGVPKIDGKVMFDKAIVNLVRQVKSDLDAVPALWIGVEDSDNDWYDPLILLAIWRQYAVDTNPVEAGIIELQLEGF